MGSTISKVVPNWKLRKLEKIIVNEHKAKIWLWLRYEDDIFIIAAKHINLHKILI